MASQPNPSLPLFYQDLVPLNTNEHGDWRSRKTDKAPWLAATHAVPLTVEEFLAWQYSIDRHGLAGLRTTRIQQYRQ